MIIRYASAHRWLKRLDDDAFNAFGGNDKARLRSSISKIESSGITFKIEPLNDSFLEWFVPMYEKRILEKDNPTVFDIRDKTLGNPKKKDKYFSLALYENRLPCGGVIFSEKDEYVSVAYRTLENKWDKAILQARPSLYTEYLIDTYAINANKKYIIHGKDRNPYGINSSIGLANFKLSVGCKPQLPKKYAIEMIDTDELSKDALILECPEVISDNADIKKAYLVVDEAGYEKWQSLLKYSDRLAIEVIKRNL